MPKVPQPTKTPASISPALWQNDNREEILTFLGDHGGAYLFYEVMQNDPDPESSAIDKANAEKVDTITNLQKAQFFAQADSMHLDEKKKTPVKKKPEAGDEGEIEKAFDGGEGGAITFQKIPTGVYGHHNNALIMGSDGHFIFAIAVDVSNFKITQSIEAPAP